MPIPRLDRDDIGLLRDQFEAWMSGARARAQGQTMQDIPHPARSNKGDAWENGWEVIDMELAAADWMRSNKQ